MAIHPDAESTGLAGKSADQAAAGELDAQLLERFLSAREEEAFALLVHRHGRVVLHLCRRILGDGHDAEDAFQATFLILARRAGAVRRQGAVGSWLCGVATRVAVRLRGQRSQRRGAEVGASSLIPVPSPSADENRDPLDQFPAPPNRSADPAAVAGQSDDELVLTEELGRLPEKYRAPLVLCYLEGQTTEQAALRLRWPVGTFRSRLAKARDLIRTRLTRRGVVLTSTTLAVLLAGEAAWATVPASLLQATTSLVGPTAVPASPRVAAVVQEMVRSMRLPSLLLGAAAIVLSLILAVVTGILTAGSKPEPVPELVLQPTVNVPIKPGPTLIVANQKCGTVTLIDVATGKIRVSVAGDPCPHEVAVSPLGTTAAVSSYGLPFGTQHGNSIKIIEVATGKAKAIDLGKYTAPHGIQWLDEERLLCTSETAGALLEIDTRKGAVVRALATQQQGSHMLAVSADRRRAYTANVGSNSVTVFDLGKGTKIRDVEVGKGAEGIALSPDDRWLWVGNRADRTVSVIDTNDLRVVKTLPTPGNPLRIAFSRDGKRAAVTEPTTGALAVYDTASFQEVKRIRLNQGRVQLETAEPLPGPGAIVFAPDGTIAYCTVFASNTVAVIDLAKGEVVKTLGAGIGPDGIAFVPAAAAG
jgi:RNA polymerase sigma factor (sigma-70 family)